MTQPTGGTTTLTRTQTETQPGDDQLSHRFCQYERWNQKAPGEPATARCGKTKTGWSNSTGTDMMCVICEDFTRTRKCVHCERLSERSN